MNEPCRCSRCWRSYPYTEAGKLCLADECRRLRTPHSAAASGPCLGIIVVDTLLGERRGNYRCERCGFETPRARYDVKLSARWHICPACGEAGIKVSDKQNAWGRVGQVQQQRAKGAHGGINRH